MTPLKLLIHILFDHMHWHMTRTFDDRLYIMFPGNMSKLPERFQFAKLGGVISIRNASRPQSVAEREFNQLPRDVPAAQVTCRLRHPGISFPVTARRMVPV